MREGIDKSVALMGSVLIFIALAYIYRDIILLPNMNWAKRSTILESQVLNNIVLAVAMSFSFIPLFLSYFLRMDKKWIYTTQFLVSYLLGFFFLSSCLNFFKDSIYPFTYGLITQEIKDLSGSELYRLALSQNPIYQYFLGWSMLATAFLICFRRTRPIGTIMATVISVNIFFISSGYESRSDKAMLMLGMSSFLLLSEWQWFSSLFLFNQKVKRRKFPFVKKGKRYEVLTISKLICLVGTLIFFHFKKENNWYYAMKQKENPIVGAWKLDYSNSDIERNQTKEFLEAETLFFDKGSSGFIELNDSISGFKYLLDPEHDQFDMYAFNKLREIDFKGKYELIDQDTLLFKGKNQKDSLIIRMIREKEYDRYLQR